jgi:DNA-binding transcriptional regulator YiaG
MPDLTPEQIRQARTDAGLTRLELAAKMTNATPDQLAMALRMQSLVKTIRHWESGEQHPSPIYADLLIRTLNLDS